MKPSACPSRATRRKRLRQVVQILRERYPHVACDLHFASPLQLLVAVVLSAQSTDAQVNRVTRTLFDRYRTVEDFAEADPEQLEDAVRRIGFFRAKSRNIRAACQKIIAEHGGQVPQSLEEMVLLPGVGRKTAHVVLGNAFGIPSGVAVDTHVGRITHRLGVTEHVDPVKIERDLVDLLPQSDWIDSTHLLIRFGREICRARRPRCLECPLTRLCPRVGVTEVARA